MISTGQRPRAWKRGLCMAFLPLAACTEATGPGPDSRELLVDVSADVGLDFTHYNGFTGHRYLVETMGGGVAWLDYDGDGMLDAYFVQSAPLQGSALTEKPPTNRLMRNAGNGIFVDTTTDAGVGDPGFGIGCAVGDYDGNGHADIYVVNFGANVLYRNNGDGTFSDVSAQAGVDDQAWGVSAGFADFDRDGDLDLYVVNYLAFTCEMQAALFPRRGGKAPAYPHPDRFDGAPDVLYENQGDGTFIDASASSGIAGVQPGPGKGLGLGFSDVDNDGDADIYVANDSTRNFLFLNDGSGHFEESGDIAGCSHNRNGESEASMGVDFGDTDGDGRIDLFMTHLDGETNTFYRNESTDDWVEWRDITAGNGLARASVMVTGFGATFLDLEADRDLDLFIANGHVIDNIAEVMSNRRHAQSDLLFLNRGDGHFDDVSGEAGSYFERRLVGRGTALGDFDGDGDPDILLGCNGDRALLLENRAARDNHWIRVRLVGGTGEPRDGQGSRVTIEAAGQEQVREMWTCRSYASASENVLHFGLGQATSVSHLKVRWPSGAVQHFTDLAVDREHTLHSD